MYLLGHLWILWALQKVFSLYCLPFSFTCLFYYFEDFNFILNILKQTTKLSIMSPNKNVTYKNHLPLFYYFLLWHFIFHLLGTYCNMKGKRTSNASSNSSSCWIIHCFSWTSYAAYKNKHLSAFWSTSGLSPLRHCSLLVLVLSRMGCGGVIMFVSSKH